MLCLDGAGIDARAEGLTGQFTKNAAVVCGGRNSNETLNKCFELDPIMNRLKVAHLVQSLRMSNKESFLLSNIFCPGDSFIM